MDVIIVSEDQNSFNPTLIFGRDILFTKLEYMTFRTNLRFTPRLNIDVNGVLAPNAQLEFNLYYILKDFSISEGMKSNYWKLCNKLDNMNKNSSIGIDTTQSSMKNEKNVNARLLLGIDT